MLEDVVGRDAADDAKRVPIARKLHRRLQVVFRALCQIPCPLCYRSFRVEEHRGIINDLIDVAIRIGVLKMLEDVPFGGPVCAAIEANVNFQKLSIQEVMTKNCKSIEPHETALIAMQLMENNSLNSLPVVDSENRIVGAINMHTLIQAKLF